VLSQCLGCSIRRDFLQIATHAGQKSAIDGLTRRPLHFPKADWISYPDVCNVPRTSPHFSGRSDDASPMTTYQGFKVFSHVVLAMMLAGIAYASYIAVTYWTGISV
jgi:hypothetical protein